MINKIKNKIIKNPEIIALSLLVIIMIISTTYYNYNKKKILENYKSTINNLYLKKTLNYFFDNLEPRFKKINHKISMGETFDKILEKYKLKRLVKENSKYIFTDKSLENFFYIDIIKKIFFFL